MKGSIFLIVALGLVGFTYAKGAKTYGDTCNFLASGIQIFSAENYGEACDTDKNLVCAINSCTCIPGTRWEQNFLGQIVGLGGACVNSANGMKGVGVFVTVVVAFLASFRAVFY